MIDGRSRRACVVINSIRRFRAASIRGPSVTPCQGAEKLAMFSNYVEEKSNHRRCSRYKKRFLRPDTDVEGDAMVRDGVANIVIKLQESGFDPRKIGPDSWESCCPAHRSADAPSISAVDGVRIRWMGSVR